MNIKKSGHSRFKLYIAGGLAHSLRRILGHNEGLGTHDRSLAGEASPCHYRISGVCAVR